jgi:hypothetical protein
VSHGVNSLDSLRTFVTNEIAALVSAIPRGEASYLHLLSLGCALVQITSVPFEHVWLTSYRGLFTQGFMPEEVAADLRGPLAAERLLIPSLRDASRQQIAALNERALREGLMRGSLEPYTDAIVELFNRNAMTPEEVLQVLVDIDPTMSHLADTWTATPLCSLRLSAVGMAIAHAHWRQLTGNDAPLAEWISEGGSR